MVAGPMLFLGHLAPSVQSDPPSELGKQDQYLIGGCQKAMKLEFA